jgi:hypothetical protein
MASAYLPLLHICEIAVRNAISEAIEQVYGPNWPWATGFERSLQRSKYGYSPLDDLVSTKKKHSTTGAVIADLKFNFWQSMMKASHKSRLWDKYLTLAFPNMPISAFGSNDAAFKHIYKELDRIRKFRNRIAHHEPIFTQNHSDLLNAIMTLIEYRSVETRIWANQFDSISTLLRDRSNFLKRPWVR